MPLTRPTLAQLIEQLRADIDARLPGADSRIRRGILDVLSRAVAGALNGVYGFLDFISRQIFPDLAEEENLERWASIYGITLNEATFAAGNVDAAGIDGTVVPVGTIVARADGNQYAVQADVTIATGVGLLSVVALTAGAAANAEPGVKLSFLSPIAGVNSQATVAVGGVSFGRDLETYESLRARVLERIRRPPQGGALNDYITWAKTVPGVTRVWVVEGHVGVGSVGVFFVLDADPVSIIPDGAEIAAVTAVIEERRPITADVVVFAPILQTQPFEIDISPDTPEVRAAINAEIDDLFFRESQPNGGVVLISHIREAISLAAGEFDHVLVSPTANITVTGNKVLVRGAMTWGSL